MSYLDDLDPLVKADARELLAPYMYDPCSRCKEYLGDKPNPYHTVGHKFCPCGRETVLRVDFLQGHCTNCGNRIPCLTQVCTASRFDRFFDIYQHFAGVDWYVGRYFLKQEAV